MPRPSKLTVLVLVVCFAAVAVPGSALHYTNVWAVEVEGGKEHADSLAIKYNFENKGQVCQRNVARSMNSRTFAFSAGRYSGGCVRILASRVYL